MIPFGGSWKKKKKKKNSWRGRERQLATHTHSLTHSLTLPPSPPLSLSFSLSVHSLSLSFVPSLREECGRSARERDGASDGERGREGGSASERVSVCECVSAACFSSLRRTSE